MPRAPVLLAILAAGGLVALAAPGSAPADPHQGARVLDRAKTACPGEFRTAVRRDAQLLPTPDGRSYYVLWYPFDDPQPRPAVIVTLHGESDWALQEFARWLPHAERYNLGILALQWRFGDAAAPAEYTHAQAFEQLETILREQEIAQGQALLHGFSRGGALVYAMTALDRARGGRFYGATLANAAGATGDAPLTRELSRGDFGPAPFSGTRWMFYCAGADVQPQRDGCAGMDLTRAWVVRLGGVIELFMDDPPAAHDGFHLRRAYKEQVAELFAQLVQDEAARYLRP